MMTCQEWQEWLLNKDDTAADTAVLAERHLEVCSACQKISLLDSQLETNIKDTLRHVEPPARLLAKIEMNMASSTTATRRHGLGEWISWKRLTPMLATAAIMLFAMFYPSIGQLRNLQQIGILSVDNHLEYLPMSFATDAVQDLPEWFEERLDFRVAAPNLIAQDLRLTGGRKCSLGKNDVAYLSYEEAGSRASLFIIDPADVSFEMKDTEEYTLLDRGCQVKIWKEAELVYALVR
ncbi:MAG: hypothetical protein GY801_44440 [bacterium]|nr:hypothetical protein [bacterium]